MSDKINVLISEEDVEKRIQSSGPILILCEQRGVQIWNNCCRLE